MRLRAAAARRGLRAGARVESESKVERASADTSLPTAEAMLEFCFTKRRAWRPATLRSSRRAPFSTEIDFLNGLVADKGDEAGISAPTHRALVQVVKEVERNEVSPSPALVDRVWELAAIRPVAIAQPAH